MKPIGIQKVLTPKPPPPPFPLLAPFLSLGTFVLFGPSCSRRQHRYMAQGAASSIKPLPPLPRPSFKFTSHLLSFLKLPYFSSVFCFWGGDTPLINCRKRTAPMEGSFHAPGFMKIEKFHGLRVVTWVGLDNDTVCSRLKGKKTFG